MSFLPMSAIVLHVGVGRRVPHDHLRVLLETGFDGHGRELVGVLDALVGVHVAQEDAAVGVHLRGDGLVADGRAAGADLELDAGVDAAGSEGARDRHLGLVDRVVGAEQVVQEAVLGLRVPVGLDDDGVGADALQAGHLGRCRRCWNRGRRCRGGGRRRGGRGAVVAAGAVVPAGWVAGAAVVDDFALLPHAARAMAPASDTAINERVRRRCICSPFC